MKLKRSSFIFLSILFIILIFTIGVRYGQRVEKTNKAIDYLISLPPSPTIQPTQKPLEFKNYSNKTCGIEFTYPFNLKIKETSTSASFIDKKETLIEFTCEKKNDLQEVLETKAIATSELMFKNRKIVAKNPGQGHTTRDLYIFKFVNPKDNKNIFVKILENYYPLFEKTLEFIP